MPSPFLDEEPRGSSASSAASVHTDVLGCDSDIDGPPDPSALGDAPPLPPPPPPPPALAISPLAARGGPPARRLRRRVGVQPLDSPRCLGPQFCCGLWPPRARRASANPRIPCGATIGFGPPYWVLDALALGSAAPRTRASERRLFDATGAFEDRQFARGALCTLPGAGALFEAERMRGESEGEEPVVFQP